MRSPCISEPWCYPRMLFLSPRVLFLSLTVLLLSLRVLLLSLMVLTAMILLVQLPQITTPVALAQEACHNCVMKPSGRCHESKRLCHETKRLCHESERFCHEINGFVMNPRGICHESERVCHEPMGPLPWIHGVCHEGGHEIIGVLMGLEPEAVLKAKTQSLLHHRFEMRFSLDRTWCHAQSQQTLGWHVAQYKFTHTDTISSPTFCFSE